MRCAAFALILLAAGCSSSTSESANTAPAVAPEPAANAKSEPEAESEPEPEPEPEAPIDQAALEAAGGVAYFAGGCFWGVEHFLEQIDGVLGVESGYMGGHLDDPSYAEVSSEEFGHLETVRVWFDPAKVSYEVIAKRFFEIHDPTQANGQGPDIGIQYKSAVFVTGPAQRKVSEALIDRLEDRGYDVVTKIKPAQMFWIAEEGHQDYYEKKGGQPYCHAPVDRFGD